MGTTLTGTTPQDTYDSLIKVTDNGPISGTAKYLSDGLGNDSALALSTTAVGIGTSSPAGNLHIASASDTGIRIQGGASSLSYIDLADTASGTPAGSIAYNHITNAIVFNGGGTNTEFARITSAGNVGIGTSAPSDKLHVSGAGNTATFITGSGCTTYIQSVATETRIGNLTTGGGSIVFSPADSERVRVTANGLTFNGDTAAANALDDYEEGTFTPVPVGWTTNPTSLSGKYVKIGALVSVRFEFSGGVKASKTSAYFTGLPFAGASSGGGTLSSTDVDDLGIMLLDNSDRIWLTQNVFTGFSPKGTGSYMLV